ncbi:hypothetical protein C8F01DRAFT_1248091 [Mycena amicta]|nr:hypothetical protein C8F01DRAFT_1248091 [Mycena amicta]
MCQYASSVHNCNICQLPRLDGNYRKVADCYLKTCPSSVFHPLSLHRNGHAAQIIHVGKHRKLLVRSRIARVERTGDRVTCAIRFNVRRLPPSSSVPVDDPLAEPSTTSSD